MRPLLLLALGAGLLVTTPASATCMETFNEPKTGIRMGSCAAPGGPISSYLCVRDVCHYY